MLVLPWKRAAGLLYSSTPSNAVSTNFIQHKKGFAPNTEHIHCKCTYNKTFFFFLISTFTLFTPFNTKLAFKYRSHTNAKCDPGVLSVIHSQHVISDHSSYLVLTQTFQMWQHSISFSNSVGWKVSLYPLVECLCCFRGVEKVCFPVGSDAQTSRVAQGECDSSGIKFSLDVLERRSLLGQVRTHVGEEQDSVAIELYAFLTAISPTEAHAPCPDSDGI